MPKLFALDVLNDAEAATYMLQDELDKRNGCWRVPWVAAITLFRAVGHVLEKVDGENDARLSELVAQAWPRWKEDPSFKMLESYRNSTLKVYDIGVERHVIQVWSGPKRVEEASDARHYGFLLFEDKPDDAIQFLWSLHTWWGQKLGQLSGLLGNWQMDEAERQRELERFRNPS